MSEEKTNVTKFGSAKKDGGPFDELTREQLEEMIVEQVAELNRRQGVIAKLKDMLIAKEEQIYDATIRARVSKSQNGN